MNFLLFIGLLVVVVLHQWAFNGSWMMRNLENAAMSVDKQENKNHPTEQLESIGIHPESSLFEDVISIEHDPDQSALMVRLNKDGRCPRPYLVARLSGPALVSVKDFQFYEESEAAVAFPAATASNNTTRLL